jgi:hypothetical protein
MMNRVVAVQLHGSPDFVPVVAYSPADGQTGPRWLVATKPEHFGVAGGLQWKDSDDFLAVEYERRPEEED